MGEEEEEEEEVGKEAWSWEVFEHAEDEETPDDLLRTSPPPQQGSTMNAELRVLSPAVDDAEVLASSVDKLPATKSQTTLTGTTSAPLEASTPAIESSTLALVGIAGFTDGATSLPTLKAVSIEAESLSVQDGADATTTFTEEMPTTQRRNVVSTQPPLPTEATSRHTPTESSEVLGLPEMTAAMTNSNISHVDKIVESAWSREWPTPTEDSTVTTKSVPQGGISFSIIQSDSDDDSTTDESNATEEAEGVEHLFGMDLSNQETTTSETTMPVATTSQLRPSESLDSISFPLTAAPFTTTYLDNSSLAPFETLSDTTEAPSTKPAHLQKSPSVKKDPSENVTKAPAPLLRPSQTPIEIDIKIVPISGKSHEQSTICPPFCTHNPIQKLTFHSALVLGN